MVFQTSSGKEPVREWLKSQHEETRKSIGRDIAVIEWNWPVGYPLVRKLDDDLWEVRTNLSEGISRVFFTIWENKMVLLYGIIKKSKKIPKKEVDLAKRRRNGVLQGGLGNE